MPRRTFDFQRVDTKCNECIEYHSSIRISGTTHRIIHKSFLPEARCQVSNAAFRTTYIRSFRTPESRIRNLNHPTTNSSLTNSQDKSILGQLSHNAMAVIGLKRFDAAVSGQCRNLQSFRLLFFACYALPDNEINY
jgi:hypothetical protein